MNDVKNHLASSLGQKDEAPNIALAVLIAEREDREAVAALVTLLQDKKKDLRSDAIKVLYELGDRKPVLLQPHFEAFITLLAIKDNRMQWGLMTALASLVPLEAGKIYKLLSQLLDIAAQGSVITKDQLIHILLQLYALPAYRKEVRALLLEQLQIALTNQLPMYAEQVLPLVDAAEKDSFMTVLQQRLPDIDKESKRKRVEKVLKKLQQLK
jgi:HEAT repeat protein